MRDFPVTHLPVTHLPVKKDKVSTIGRKPNGTHLGSGTRQSSLFHDLTRSKVTLTRSVSFEVARF